jgi:hypothetical protein
MDPHGSGTVRTDGGADRFVDNPLRLRPLLQYNERDGHTVHIASWLLSGLDVDDLPY